MATFGTPTASVNPAAFMAVKFGDGQWYPTGAALSEALISGSGNVYNGALANLATQQWPNDATKINPAWGAVASYNLGVTRSFPGTNSSGAPRAIGRSQLGDPTVVRTPDQISPKLFEACCKGNFLSTVILFEPSYDGTNPQSTGVLTVLTDVAVTGFTYATSTTARTETLTLHFVSVKFQWFTIGVGWNTARESDTLDAAVAGS